MTWKTTENGGNTQLFDVNRVLEEMQGNDGQIKVYTMRKYMNAVAKILRYRIVRKTKQFNMTNIEVWDMVKKWKIEASLKQLISGANQML